MGYPRPRVSSRSTVRSSQPNVKHKRWRGLLAVPAVFCLISCREAPSATPLATAPDAGSALAGSASEAGDLALTAEQRQAAEAFYRRADFFRIGQAPCP